MKNQPTSAPARLRPGGPAARPGSNTSPSRLGYTHPGTRHRAFADNTLAL